MKILDLVHLVYGQTGNLLMFDDSIKSNCFIPNSVDILFTNRSGGYSSPPYDSFNLATHVGDDANITGDLTSGTGAFGGALTGGSVLTAVGNANVTGTFDVGGLSSLASTTIVGAANINATGTAATTNSAGTY